MRARSEQRRVAPMSATPDAATFLSDVETLLSDPASQLVVLATDLLSLVPAKQIEERVKQTFGPGPRISDMIGPVLGSLSRSSGSHHPFDILPSSETLSLWSAVLSHNVKTYQHARDTTAQTRLIPEFRVVRERMAMPEKEIANLRGMAALAAERAITADEWSEFYARLTWNGGSVGLTLPQDLARAKDAPAARELLRTILGAVLPKHSLLIEESS